MNPLAVLAVDLFCGLGGWTSGLLAEGYRVVGFDNEQHVYGNARYPAQLVIQDVLTLHGSQFKDAALIVASPPCQEFSYMAMPWTKAKQKAREYRDGTRDVRTLTALFDACFRIQREACEAAGRYIPLVVENVCGAQKWVGRARWHYGSFYLWGDVPALMPITRKYVNVPTMGAGWYPPDHPKHVVGLAFNGHAGRNLRQSEYLCDCGHRKEAHVYETEECEECSCIAFLSGRKMMSKRRTDVGNGVRFTSRDCGIERADTIANAQDGHKQKGSGAAWWRGEVGSKSSKSSARKAASAHIAKIPYGLARHIARAWKPTDSERKRATA